MIEQTFCFMGTGTDPYRNLAIEDGLMRAVRPGTLILYLWQNAHTVVIGKNQNCWAECDLPLLESEGGRLARRASGGGAVYHDLGNLNFTFLAAAEDYNVSRQLEIILAALNSLGIPAEKTGRNDLMAGGRKISGNAFRESGRKGCHHGTLLWSVDMEKMSRYLRPSAEKLASKGVPSVRSRVGNLVDFAPSLTLDRLCSRLCGTMGELCGCMPRPFPEEWLDPAEIAEAEARFTSTEWLYGRRMAFQWQLVRRFDWGSIDLRIAVDRGRVQEVQVYSDALDADRISALPGALAGCAFSPEVIAARLEGTGCPEFVELGAAVRDGERMN